MSCLKAFSGTIIFVSHDRSFMEALSTKTLELSYKEVSSDAVAPNAGDPTAIRHHRLFYGNYAYYLERVAQEAAEGGNTSTESLPKAIPVRADEPEAPALSASERREQEKQKQAFVKRLERRETEILKSMEELEAEKARLETELSRPEVYSSGETAKAVKLRLDECFVSLEAKSREWEAIAEELEQARSLMKT